jgi:hypothetical protein
MRRVLLLAFTAAVAALGGLASAAWVLLGSPALPRPRTLAIHDWVSVLQLVLASVAGAGALVALIVAYRRQKVAEADSGHDRTRVFNERFVTIAGQLGDDRPAVRLAGVHAMAGLADDWLEHRQTCVDVLCAYLRMPYRPEPGEDGPETEKLSFGADREVRHTAIRIITAHLRPDAPASWQGLDFDFTGVRFDGGNFSGAVFDGSEVSFAGAIFAGDHVTFAGTIFSGRVISFNNAKFIGGDVRFNTAVFSGGGVLFTNAVFSGGHVSFSHARFSGSYVSFAEAVFSGAKVDFGVAVFSGGIVRFAGAVFSGGQVSFASAIWSGAEASFGHAHFSGGQVTFSIATDWSHPPQFDFTGTPPLGVTLPPNC